jgi:hypothetical protein
MAKRANFCIRKSHRYIGLLPRIQFLLLTVGGSGRDRFNNLLIRIFSAFGIITILSGFMLQLISLKWFSKNEFQ